MKRKPQDEAVDTGILAGILAALSTAPVTIGAISKPGLVQTGAFALTGILWIWSAALILPHLRPNWLKRPRWKALRKRWPSRAYLDHHYGKFVLLAMKRQVDSHWFWVCPHCEYGNERGTDCAECGAVFDEDRFRARKAA